MFFIPIAVIVIVIWVIVHTVQDIRLGKLNAESRAAVDRTQRLYDMVVDYEATAQDEMKLRGNQAKRLAISSFMGGGEKWENFAGALDETSRTFLSLAAVKSPRGKLPGGLLMYGRTTPMMHVMSGREFAGMNEEFLLKVEDELHKHGVPAALICRRGLQGGSGGYGTEYRMREYVAQNGRGSTEGYEYVFTHE